jgi:hypothetical protein
LENTIHFVLTSRFILADSIERRDVRRFPTAKVTVDPALAYLFCCFRLPVVVGEETLWVAEMPIVSMALLRRNDRLNPRHRSNCLGNKSGLCD